MIFFFDIDGTLMPFGKDIPASAAEAIHRLRADGHKAFLSTGRSPSEVSSKVRSIGFDGAVYSSGAAVEIDGKFVFHRVWTKEEYGLALAYFASRGFPLILQSDSGTYLTEKTKDYWYSLLLEHVGRIVQVPGLQIIDGYPEEIELNKMLYIGGPLELVRSDLAPHLQVVANTVGLAPDMMGEVMLLRNQPYEPVPVSASRPASARARSVRSAAVEPCGSEISVRPIHDASAPSASGPMICAVTVIFALPISSGDAP